MFGWGDRRETGTVAVDAGEVEVAGTLIDTRLATEFGVRRLYRETVALLTAVAAPLETRSLIITRNAGVVAKLRLRSRRFSAAQA